MSIESTERQMLHMECDLEISRLRLQVQQLTEDRDYYKRAFLLLSSTRKSEDILSAR